MKISHVVFPPDLHMLTLGKRRAFVATALFSFKSGAVTTMLMRPGHGLRTKQWRAPSRTRAYFRGRA